MSRPDGALLVLGIGNALLRDEGVGLRVVDEIGRLVDRGHVVLPPGTELVDGGTRGLALLPAVVDARAVLVVDAARLGREPGSVTIVRGDALRAAPDGDPAARVAGVSRLLDVARAAGRLPDAVALVGIEPAEVAVGLDLTDAVETAVPAAIAAALGEIARLHAAAGGPGDGRATPPSTPTHRTARVMA
jgi:hydrogenase maturation protease